MKLRTIAPGELITFQTNYVGTFLLLAEATGANITSAKIGVKVVPLGDGVLCDLSPTSFDAVANWKQITSSYNNQKLIPLSDGLVPNKVTDITIDNVEGLQNIDVYMPVLKNAKMYIKSMQQTILANSQAVFTDFSGLFLDDLLPSDQVTVDWEDGSSHTFAAVELGALSSHIQDAVVQMIDNTDGRVRKVTVIPSVTKVVQLVRYMPISEL